MTVIMKVNASQKCINPTSQVICFDTTYLLFLKDTKWSLSYIYASRREDVNEE
jgi:hypothetical protein